MQDVGRGEVFGEESVYSMKHNESQKLIDSSEHLDVLIEVWGLELGRRWFCHHSRQTDRLSEKEEQKAR